MIAYLFIFIFVMHIIAALSLK